MQLDRLAINLRPRLPWEGMDLGVALWRQSWLPMIKVWLAVVFPFLAGIVWLFQDIPWLSLLLLWWFKPLYDRVLLMVYSRQVFSAIPTPAEVFSGWRDFLGSGLFSCLTFYRLDPGRSFNLPVWQLERLRGQKRWDRSRILLDQHRNYAYALLYAFVHLEVMVQYSISIIPWLIAPDVMDQGVLEFLFEADPDPVYYWLSITALIAGMTIIEPLYVACGFTHYLSRRVELEGWDIEVGFRRLEQRLASDNGDSRPSSDAGKNILGLAAALLLGSTLVNPLPAVAETEPLDYKDEIAAQLEEIQNSEEVWIRSEHTRWRKSGAEKADPASPSREAIKLNWLPLFFKAAIVIAVLVGLGILLNQYPPWRRLIGRQRKNPQPAPATQVAGLDIRRSSLPDDIPATAMALLRSGRLDEAISLLYRGALSALVNQHQLPIRESDTEGDCLGLVENRCKASTVQYFNQLTGNWISIAYGHQTPEATASEALVHSWSQHFGPAK